MSNKPKHFKSHKNNLSIENGVYFNSTLGKYIRYTSPFTNAINRARHDFNTKHYGSKKFSQIIAMYRNNN